MKQHFPGVVDRDEPEAGHDDRIDQRSHRDAQRGDATRLGTRRHDGFASAGRRRLNRFEECRRIGRRRGPVDEILAIVHCDVRRDERSERHLLDLFPLVIDQREGFEVRVASQVLVAQQERLHAALRPLRIATGEVVDAVLLREISGRESPDDRLRLSSRASCPTAALISSFACRLMSSANVCS